MGYAKWLQLRMSCEVLPGIPFYLPLVEYLLPYVLGLDGHSTVIVFASQIWALMCLQDTRKGRLFVSGDLSHILITVSHFVGTKVHFP